ncbi:MAG: enoyl-CoA hydratase/isomerase family protein [Gammaproteobacteria bacterium]|nr:enoyl-CoA hydratase/isomerase family protein [Gammaproteobacteria bacterium]
MSELVVVEQQGSITSLTLNNPAQRNPLSNAMIHELTRCLALPEVKNAGMVILRSTGKDFCAGGDINDFRDIIDATAAEQWEACEPFRALFAALHSLTPVIVAAVQGRALGGGCGLVAACDFAIAADNARFGTPEIKLGAFPMVIVPPLIQAIGVRHTMYMSTTGEPISAQQALEYGLVQQVVPGDELATRVADFCNSMSGLSASGLRVGKATLRSCAESSYGTGLEVGMGMRSILFSSPEFKQGIKKFLEPKK